MDSRSIVPLKCFCGRTYSNAIDLEEHRRARGHFPSHVCGKHCKHPLASQDTIQTHVCGCCGKICERLEILEDHRIVTGHCFCSDCDLPFKTQSALKIHLDTEVHASEFKCCDCNIFFKDIHALNAHMASRAHRKPLHQKSSEKAKKTIAITTKDQVCNICQRTFPSSVSLRQHEESVKHKPLSSLSCPIGKWCRGNFISPSALLHHLESGTCRSEMNRDGINRMAQSYDQDHVIHNPFAIASSISPTSSACIPTPNSEMSMILLDSQSEWSLVTPTLSEADIEGSDISFEGRYSIDITAAAKLQCPICPKERKSFATAESLEQHMDSPVHCAKMYHCPRTILPNGPGTTKKEMKKERSFSTLSGLAQHLESGACKGGKRTFFYCIDFIQGHLERLGFGGMRLLLPGSGR